MVTAKTAAVFVEEYGILLELSGANAFRVRAYANAVRALETLAAPLDDLLAAGTLTEVKGIGKSVGELVAEFVYERMRRQNHQSALFLLHPVKRQKRG